MPHSATTVVYINHQRGTRKYEALKEAMQIILWTKARCSEISVVHIPEMDNWKADYLSSHHLDYREWALHPDIFHRIYQKSGPWMWIPCGFNNKLPLFVARSKDPLALALDVLTILWYQFRLIYAFHLVFILPCLLHKFEQKREEACDSHWTELAQWNRVHRQIVT